MTQPSRNFDRRAVWWPVDTAFLVFHLATIALILGFRNRMADPGPWLFVSIVLLGGLFTVVRLTSPADLARAAAARVVYTVVAIPVVFTQLGSLVPYVHPGGYEQELFDFDLRLFGGVNPLEALEGMAHPVFTEALQWVYDFYYFIPVILGVAVFRAGRPLDLLRMLFAITFCILLSYVGYYLVPATGPNIDKFDLYRFETPLAGSFLTFELRETLAVIEKIKQDCFPSGHTAVSLLSLTLAYRFSRGAVGVLWPLVAALIFSTMYLRYHYVADVLAGIVLAVVSHVVGLKLHRRFEARLDRVRAISGESA